MASIAVTPKVFKNYRIKVGADNFEAAINAFQFVPTSSIQTWKGGTPSDVYTDATSPTWVCNINAAQDWETTGSFSRYLLANPGARVAAEFFPQGPTGPHFTATLILVPMAIGGNIDSWGEGSVSLGVVGVPLYVAAA